MTSKLLIEIQSPGLAELPPGYDLGFDLYLRSGRAWEMKPWEALMVPAMLAARHCSSSTPASTQPSTSPSTGGGPSERTTAKKPRPSDPARKTTTPSTTSDISWLLLVTASLRYRIMAGILIPSTDSWRSILRQNSEQPNETPQSAVIVPAGSQLPRKEREAA